MAKNKGKKPGSGENKVKNKRVRQEKKAKKEKAGGIKLRCPFCGVKFDYDLSKSESVSFIKCPRCGRWIPLYTNQDEEVYYLTPEEVEQKLKGIEIGYGFQLSEMFDVRRRNAGK